MKHYFRPYRDCNIFIETGSANGEGIIAAMNAGFPLIHSIELSQRYYDFCKREFANYPEVDLHLGNSLKWLPRILANINERCVFWLDAHWCGGETAGKGMQVPIMGELKIIAGHHIKGHTILIDDIRLLREKSELEWSDLPYCVCDIEEFIHTIDPNYKISYEFGVVEDDILIARI
jgi:hypothetical protein